MVSGRQQSRRISTSILRLCGCLTVAICLIAAPLTVAFVSKSNICNTKPATGLSRTFVPSTRIAPGSLCSPRLQTTELKFMGSDGGILGIGTPELFTILLVGYFILGPSDLYKLTKEIGKFVQNFQTFTSEATSSLETNLESNLQLEEIRKAQRELNEAFSFRRSINVEADTDPFEVNAQSPRIPEPEAAVASATAAVAATAEDVTAAPKKKIRRRRVKKKQIVEEEQSEDSYDFTGLAEAINEGPTTAGNVPDLSVEDESMFESEEAATRELREAREELRQEAMDEEVAQLRQERMARLQESAGTDEEKEAKAARFQSQVAGNWNDQILAKGDELSPLAAIMDRLALLEEEKQNADERLQEEFRLREKNEERFYKEKRQLLEEAAAQVQAEVYATDFNGAEVSKTPTSGKVL